jgi:hypothetical protein
MSEAADHLRVALGQMCSATTHAPNIAVMQEFARDAAERAQIFYVCLKWRV